MQVFDRELGGEVGVPDFVFFEFGEAGPGDVFLHDFEELIVIDASIAGQGDALAEGLIDAGDLEVHGEFDGCGLVRGADVVAFC